MALGGKITPQEEIYCNEYIIDLDRIRAAQVAYPKLNGKTLVNKANDLMTKFRVLDRIHTLKTERRDRLQLSQTSVLEKIAEVVDRCMQSVPVMENGIHTGEYKFDASNALKGLELYGKHLAMWTDRLHITDPIGEILAKKLDTLSTDDLIQLSKWAKGISGGNPVLPSGIKVISPTN